MERSADKENTILAAAVYYTGNSPRNVAAVFNAMQLHFISETCYYKKIRTKLQQNLLSIWTTHQSELLSGKHSFVVAGDMRADSPGMFVDLSLLIEYQTYSLLLYLC